MSVGGRNHPSEGSGHTCENREGSGQVGAAGQAGRCTGGVVSCCAEVWERQGPARLMPPGAQEGGVGGELSQRGPLSLTPFVICEPPSSVRASHGYGEATAGPDRGRMG